MEVCKIEKTEQSFVKKKNKKGEETNFKESDRNVFEAVDKYLTDTDSEIEFLEHLEQYESEKSRKVVLKNKNRKSNKK